MSKILSIAQLGSSAPAKSTEISFSGFQFHIWAILEIIAYSFWYSLHPVSFVFAVSLFFSLQTNHLTLL